MIFIDASKWLAILWVFSLTNYASGDEYNTSLLLVTFIYSVIEIIIVVSAFRRLFGGLITLGYFNENTAILGAKKKGAKKIIQKKSESDHILIIFKAILTTLSEFAVLTTHTYDDTSPLNNIYSYISYLRAISVFLVSLVGIVWLVKIIVYFARASRDSVFNESVRENYSRKIAPNIGVHVKRASNLGFLALVFASIFAIDFRVDNFSLIPDTISAACLIISILFIAQYLPENLRKSRRLNLFAPLVLYLTASGIGYYAEYYFFSEYNFNSVYRYEEAYNLYIVLCVVKIVEALTFVFAIYSITVALRGLIKNHVGFVPINGDVDRLLDETQRDISKCLIFFFAAGCISAAGDLFYIFGALEIPIAGLVNFITSALFVFSVFNAKSEISEGISARYLYD